MDSFLSNDVIVMDQDIDDLLNEGDCTNLHSLHWPVQKNCRRNERITLEKSEIFVCFSTKKKTFGWFFLLEKDFQLAEQNQVNRSEEVE